MTAVKWLLENLISEPYSETDFEHNEKCWNKAEEMEKQQILDCCITTTQDVWISAMGAFGQEINFCDEDLEEQKQEAEQYYKETFKQKEQ